MNVRERDPRWKINKFQWGQTPLIFVAGVGLSVAGFFGSTVCPLRGSPALLAPCGAVPNSRFLRNRSNRDRFIHMSLRCSAAPIRRKNLPPTNRHRILPRQTHPFSHFFLCHGTSRGLGGRPLTGVGAAEHRRSVAIKRALSEWLARQRKPRVSRARNRPRSAGNPRSGQVVVSQRSSPQPVTYSHHRGSMESDPIEISGVRGG